LSSGGRNRTYGLLVQSQASLPTATTPECGECSAGIEPASPGWKPGAFAARPRAQCLSFSGRKGSRTLKAGYPRSGWLDRFRSGCHHQLACPSVLVFKSCGGRNRTCVRVVNSRLVRTSTGPTAIVHRVTMAGFEPAISCSRSTRQYQAFPHPEIKSA
jgi:hypothetical protein